MTPPASWAVATPVLRILPMLGLDRSSSGGGGSSRWLWEIDDERKNARAPPPLPLFFGFKQIHP